MVVGFSSITRAEGSVQNAQVLWLIAVMPCIIDITPSLSTAIGFVHAGLASRSLCAQIFGAWGDTDTAQVEAIGVPTGQNGRIPLGHAIAVVHTGELKQIHFFISGIKVMASQAAGKRCAACAMTIVHVFVESAGIVKKGKQFHHVPIGACLFCQHEAVCPYTRPVRDAVVAPPIDLELLTQMLKEVVAAVEKHYKLK
jgi:hypothetical protein